MGRRLSESLEQGLVMAPPRARMTNDRSTGVAINVKLAGIGTSRRLLRYRPQAAARLCRLCGEVVNLDAVWM